MTPASAVRRRPVDKFDARRDELAESALQTLAERGYANTGLRDIAANSPYSHGVVHYYFSDKTELITYCVRYYKARCVTRYDDLVSGSATADELRERFAAKLAETLVEEARLHRVWYDLRSQSMFDDSLRSDVDAIDDTLQQMVWRVVERYAALSGRPAAMDAGTTYALLDGLFEQALLDHLGGDAQAAATLSARAARVLPLLLG